jgi:hypothetical protein
MKKLLTTSALAGALTFVAATASVAQTTVSGSLDLTLRGQSFSATNGSSSDNLFGRETQINVANKGKLNNGMDYAAGFSLEFDGGGSLAEGAGSTSNENVYINLIAGSTTLTFGVDHIQNPKQDLLNSTIDILDEAVTVNNSAFTYSGRGIAKESIGAGIVQTLAPGVTASVWYAPNANNEGTANDGAAILAVNDGTDNVNGNGIYEIGLRAKNIGGSGIDVEAWNSSREQGLGGSETSDETGRALSLNYTKGPFGVGAALIKNKSALSIEKEVQLAHVTYAISKDLSASAIYGVVDLQNGTADEKLSGIQIGYNLGPVGVGIAVTKQENIGSAVSGGDVDMAVIKVGAKF